MIQKFFPTLAVSFSALFFSLQANAQDFDSRRYVLLLLSVSQSGEQRPIPCEKCNFQSPELCEKQAEKVKKDFQLAGARIATSCVDRGFR